MQYLAEPVILDDSFMSSSPLKQVAARHQLHRARTAPANVLSNVLVPTRSSVTRTPSEEFLALERAHAIISSGASKMGLQELVKATRMINNISTALSDQMSKKLINNSLASP